MQSKAYLIVMLYIMVNFSKIRHFFFFLICEVGEDRQHNNDI